MTELSPIFSLIQEPQIKSAQLADAILRLSDFFVDNPDDLTPWEYDYCKQAYRYYYLPLNYIRNEQVIHRGLQVGFFNGIATTVDWGAGPGTASLALANTLPFKLNRQILIDQSKAALQNFSDLQKNLQQPSFSTDLDLKCLNLDLKKSLLVFSYSMTEMTELPEGALDFESLMILEPSTQDDGRKLQELRQKLIDAGYLIWAPCTHQASCPLTIQSKTDWCHDRFHVQAPERFWSLEKNLPFRNKTITTSYLLAKKTPPPENLKTYARTVGDSMTEKGKTRQLVCRGTDREFLAWMHKDKNIQTIPRGELVSLPTDLELKSNELRVKSEVIVNDFKE